MRSDSPPMSWYQPPDILDDDSEPDPNVPEPLVIAAGIVIWTLTHD